MHGTKNHKLIILYFFVQFNNEEARNCLHYDSVKTKLVKLYRLQIIMKIKLKN